MNKVQEVAFAAARKAGAIQKERLGNVGRLDYKSAFNIVTEVDRQCEQEIIATVRQSFADDEFLGEESGAHKTGSTRLWIIDPVDGTTNYTHGYPFFCVSIGVQENGKTIFGAVYNVMADEMFWALAGQGSYLNDKKIQVSTVDRLSTSLLATGFPADTRGCRQSNMQEFSRITDQSHGVRRDGAAALDLSFVACGRLDGFWEFKLSAWDLAAGELIVREAGGKITNLTGGPFDLYSGHIIASNGLIHDELNTALAFDANNMPAVVKAQETAR